MKNSIEYLDKIVNILEKPYFQELGLYGIDDDDEQEYVLKKVCVSYKNSEYDIIQKRGSYITVNGVMIYFEHLHGRWTEFKYDVNGNEIYVGNSEGTWIKKEYNSKGLRIYTIDNHGIETGFIKNKRNE